MDNIPQMNPNEFLQAIFDIQAADNPPPPPPPAPVIGQDNDTTYIAG